MKLLDYQIIKLISKSKTTPGTPNKPTKIEVNIFIPIWNPHTVPIMLIMYSKIAPKTEFKSNFKIIFTGTIKIFPIIKTIIKQIKYIITEFMSISFTFLF